MPVDFDYISTSTFNLIEVESILERAKLKFKDLDLLDETDQVYVYLENLDKPRLLRLDKIKNLCKFKLEAYLERMPVSWGDMASVVKIYQSDLEIIEHSNLFLHIGCEQKGTKQTTKGHDFISIRLESGKYFLYYTGGNRLSDDNAYARKIFAKYINDLALPVAIEEGEGYFKLKALQGELRLTGSKLFGKDPSGFACEIPETKPDDLINKMKAAFELMSSGKVFECSWRIFPTSLDGSQYKNNKFALLDLIRRQPWPASSFDLDLTLESISLPDLEALRGGFGESDQIFTPMLSMHIKDQALGDYRDKIYGDIGVRTIQKGHKVELSLSATETPDEIAEEVGKVLNLDFVRA